jgi:electron transport complex protein RnfA
VALLNAKDDQGLFHAIALSLGAGLGFWLVLSLFSDLRQRTPITIFRCPSAACRST